MYIMGDYNLPHLQMLDETNLHDNGIGRRNASGYITYKELKNNPIADYLLKDLKSKKLPLLDTQKSHFKNNNAHSITHKTTIICDISYTGLSHL
ncbi:unnamed protein product [Acanthoscelides obtectus]|uniref:Uncharacterized protein n=1 Tax=Acanthoscelides obtectus TaxID=200917 RepID=A0A9P0MB28_ACAOB|nr:unnamed protein product [Acanthoscelides obtectus]CAK1670565.1 hypothetical protein AOBTE_LOCUS27676 [Acanthoscelides obtectus]